MQSDIELPELFVGQLEEQPIITVALETVQEPQADLPEVRYQNNRILGPSLFYLLLKDSARFLAKKEDNATHIYIDVIDPERMPLIKSWFYGSVLTAALQMNDRFAIHASAVLHQDKLILFCGPSGIGKSTLASHLHTRGYPIFSDDKCVLEWNDATQSFDVYPSLKIARLWEDATDQISDTSFLHSPEKVTLRENKFQYLLDDEQAIEQSMPVKAIYRIHRMHGQSALSIRSPKGIQRIRQLRNQTHRLNFVEGLGKQKAHWHHMDQITRHVPYQVLVRPKETPINDFVDFVEESFTKA